MADTPTANQLSESGQIDCSVLLNVGKEFDFTPEQLQQMVNVTAQKTAPEWRAYLRSQTGVVTDKIIAGFANYKSRIPAGSGSHGGAL